MQPKVSIIIPAWGDDHALAKTLIINWPLFSATAEELIICTDNASASDVAQMTTKIVSSQGASPSRIAVLNGGELVSKTALLNQGFIASQGDCLLFSDADILWTEQSIHAFISVVVDGRIAHAKKIERWPDGAQATNNDAFSTKSFLTEIRETAQFFSADGRVASVQKSAIYPRDSARSGPGILGISRYYFESIGGYNGDLRTYGWEDIDILVRAGLLLNAGSEAVGSLYEMRSVRHPGELGRRLISEASNYQVCVANYCIGLLRGSLSSTVPAIEQPINRPVSSGN